MRKKRGKGKKIGIIALGASFLFAIGIAIGVTGAQGQALGGAASGARDSIEGAASAEQGVSEGEASPGGAAVLNTERQGDADVGGSDAGAGEVGMDAADADDDTSDEGGSPDAGDASDEGDAFDVGDLLDEGDDSSGADGNADASTRDGQSDTGAAGDAALVGVNGEESGMDAAENAQNGEDGTARERGYVFLGDSRFYCMDEDCGVGRTANFFVVSCPGVGYDWMAGTGFSKIRIIQRQHPEIGDWTVVSGFGVNDPWNAGRYIEAYRDLSKSVDLWLLSVNPTDGFLDAKYSNDCIEAFNARISSIPEMDYKYIDSYSHLVKKGFETEDGLHYTENSNWEVYSYILSSLTAGRDCAPPVDVDAKEEARSLAAALGG